MQTIDPRNMLRTFTTHTRAAALPLLLLAVVLGVAAGLHYAHQRVGPDGAPLGIVHRDVSPQNVLVSFEGSVKLVDFGIAKVAAHTSATRTGTLKGKVGYMSPEQCRGEPLDRRSDVFALGILLYELTTGRRMFFGDNDYAVMNRVTSGAYTRPSAVSPDYPAALEQICLRAVHLDRDQRHPTAEALQSDLEDFIRGEQMIVSSRLLAQTMRALFGERLPPTPEMLPASRRPEPALQPLIAEDGEPPTRKTGAPTVAAPRTRRPATLLAALSGAALIAAAIFMRSPDQASPETPPSVTAGDARDAAPATHAPFVADAPAVAATVSAPAAPAEVPATTATTATTASSVAPPEAPPGAADLAKPGRDAPRRTHKGRSPRPSSPSPTSSSRDLDAMFPGGR